MAADPSIYNALQPQNNAAQSFAQGVSAANALTEGRAMRQQLSRQAGVRNVLQGEDLDSPTILQDVARIDPQQAIALKPLADDYRQQTIQRDSRSFDIYGQTLDAVHKKFNDTVAANPEMTPADRQELLTNLWNPARYNLMRMLAPTSKAQSNLPQTPSLMGGRGLTREDIPLTMSEDDLVQHKQLTDNIRTQYGDAMNVTTAEGKTSTMRGTTSQLIAAAGPGGQISKIGEKPVYFMDPKEKATLTDSQSQQFLNHPAVSNMMGVQNVLGNIRDAIGDGKNIDQAKAYTAVVQWTMAHSGGKTPTDGGIAAAQDAGLTSGQGAMIRNIVQGNGAVKVDPDLLKAILPDAQNLYENSYKQYQDARDLYAGRAARMKLNPDDVVGVVPDRHAELSKPVPQAKLPPPPAQAKLPTFNTVQELQAAVRAGKIKSGQQFMVQGEDKPRTVN